MRGLILFFMASTAFAQYAPFGAHFSTALGTGTFTLIQTHNCSFSSGTTCSITVSPSLAAGNLDIFACESDNNAAPPKVVITGVSAGGTLVTLPGASSGGILTGSDNSEGSVAMILPSTSTGGTTPIVVTMGQAVTFGSSCYLAEYHPSANPANVALDIDGGFQGVSAVTSATNLNATLSGTGDACLQTYFPVNTFNAYPTAVTSPYNTSAFFTSSGDAAGYSVALPANGNGPTWTIGSAQPFTGMACVGWNPTTGLEQSFNDFEGGTAGSATTTALLAASMHGWQGGSWVGAVGTINYNATNKPLQNATGRLYGDGASYVSGAGSLGIVETGTGAGTTNSLTYGWKQSGLTSLTYSFWFCSDLVNTDTTAVDIGLIGTDATDFANVTFAQTGASRYFVLETPAGNSAITNYSSGTGCGAGGTGWVNIQVQYRRSPTVGGAQMAIFDTTGAQVGTTASATTSGTSNPVKIVIGHLGTQTITTGKHDFWDSVKIDLSGTFPLTI